MSQGIYAIINAESNKCYIGSTTNLQKRWGQHKTRLRNKQHNNPHLQNAWNKYGKDVFSFMICEYVENPEHLIEREQYWLDEFRLLCPVYNYGLIARHPMLGRYPSEETRRKLSKTSTGRHHNEETCRKLSELNKGKTLSKETRRKISEAHKGKILSEETRRKIGVGNKGKCYSKETRARISAAKAKPYPAFRHELTGEIIPAGTNLKALCKERNLNPTRMRMVKIGNQHQHKGWVVKDGN